MIDKLTSTKLSMVKLIRRLTMLAKTHFSIFLSNGRVVP